MAERAPVAVLISGRGSNMAALIYAAKADDCPFEVVLVASDRVDAAGLAVAAAEGVPVAVCEGGREVLFEKIATALRQAGADYVALAGFMRILPAEFVAQWQDRLINVHPSLLPAHKGLRTHEAVLAAGETVSGCTVHHVTANLDDGPILGRTEVAVLPGDTPATLAERVLIAEHQLYPRMLAELVTAGTRPESLLQRAREIALALPQAEEKLSHGSPGFFVRGGKFFAYFSDNHHGDGRTAVLVKISGLDEQSMLIDRDSGRYFRPAYFGDGWIGIRLDLGDTDWDHIADRLAQSWGMSAPKRLQAMIGL